MQVFYNTRLYFDADSQIWPNYIGPRGKSYRFVQPCQLFLKNLNVNEFATKIREMYTRYYVQTAIG